MGWMSRITIITPKIVGLTQAGIPESPNQRLGKPKEQPADNRSGHVAQTADEHDGEGLKECGLCNARREHEQRTDQASCCGG